MSSLLNMLAGSLDEKTISQLASQLGADDKATQQAINAALPMLVGALGKNVESQDGAQALAGALSSHDGSILDDVLGNLTNPNTMQDGAKILGHVLGGQEAKVERGISQATGLKTDSTAQLMSMLAPLVLGALGKQSQKQGLDAQGIASLLQGESSAAQSQIGGFAKLLDLDGDGDATNDVMNLGGKVLKSLFGGR
ncbi:MAG: DUF937 domain-containing protein [Caldilineaceae bacterium]|nr:DUF937 domain-containing protein [Caldilineaceae bacterium]